LNEIGFYGLRRSISWAGGALSAAAAAHPRLLANSLTLTPARRPICFISLSLLMEIMAYFLRRLHHNSHSSMFNTMPPLLDRCLSACLAAGCKKSCEIMASNNAFYRTLGVQFIFTKRGREITWSKLQLNCVQVQIMLQKNMKNIVKKAHVFFKEVKNSVI
jgi:hypothetical protein